MSTRIAGAARGAFAALVAVGLSLGARAAVAAPAAPPDCAYQPWRGYPGVSCSVNADCTSTCKFYYGDYSIGKCINGCCLCTY